MKLKKRILSMALVGIVSVGVVKSMNFNSSAARDFNYGEAFQKSLMFYEFQKSGELPDNQRNNWRSDSGMKDGSDVGLDLTGGWYDAGDHVKFNLPMSYTSTMLAWSYIEDSDVYKKSGQDVYMLDEIKWANDYFIKCHPKANEYYYQVGNGGKDHAFWGAAEIMQMERPAYKLDMQHPGSAVSAETAASLAACSIVYKEQDKEYANNCLKHAKELLEFAEATKSDEGYMEQAGGYYSSHSGFYDELSWASTWIYMATKEESYLKKAEEYAKHWGKEQGTETVCYKWAHGWDDVHIGTSLLLTKLTKEEKYKEIIENHLNYWSVGVNGEKVKYTPKGLAWLDTWGSLRYASTTAFLASIYADWDGCNETNAKNYKEFAKSQADYILGSTGQSYVVGFGENSPQRPHHRTAHGGYENNVSGNPKTHRHVLIGALVGGPDVNDKYTDDISDYVCNEVACDYNAGFHGLMAKMYKEYGGTIDKNLNAKEEIGEELYLEAGVNAKDDRNKESYVEIKAIVYNTTAWPARVTDQLSYRYFVDISDVIKNGYTAKDMKVTTNYNQSGAKVSELKAWDAKNGIYYVDIDLAGVKIYPGGQSEHRSELQFRITAPSKWDFTASPSFAGLSETSSNKLVRAKGMALYDGGKLVYGAEPNGKLVENTSEPTNSPVITNGPTSQPDVTTAPTNQPIVTTNPTNNPEKQEIKVSVKPQGGESSNTIGGTFTVTNTSDQEVSLSDFSFRYYYTSDKEIKETVYLDDAAFNSKKSPWYQSLSSNVSYQLVKMNKPTSTADSYVEVSFDSDLKLDAQSKVELGVRVARKDWSKYDQTNDYSYINGVVGYNHSKIVCGTEVN